MPDIIQSWDFAVLDFIQENMRSAFLDVILPAITHLADAGWFWILLALILIATKKYRLTGIAAGTALIFGLLIGNCFLKPVVARIRPYDINTSVVLLVDRLSDFSFPSGHTLASFEAATVLMLRERKFGIPALLLAILIAFSRLYLYVHYPTDVLCGLVLGVIFGIIACVLVDRLAPVIGEKLKGKNKTNE